MRGSPRRRPRGVGALGVGPLRDTVLVRPAVAGDAAEIARVHVASWRAGYRGLVADAILDGLDAAERTEQWRDWLADVTVLIAEHAGEICGFAALAVPARELGEPATGEVAALYVDPARWRHGVGRALMDAAAAELRDEGCREAVVWVLEPNAAGCAFYAALGFTPDGGRSTDARTGLPEIRLRAPLG